MARDAHVIDIENLPEVDRLVDEVRESNEPRVLRSHGKDVALLLPIDPSQDYGPERTKTPADYEAFLRSAGSWKGHLDADAFIAETYERRAVASRPPVDL